MFNKIFIKKNQVKTMIALIIYKITLDLVYAFFVTPNYSYTGLNFDFSLRRYLVSSGIFLLMIFSLLKIMESKRPSSYIVFLINLIYFIPGCTLFALSTNGSSQYFLYYTLYWLIFNVLNLSIPRINLHFPKIKNRKIVFYTILAVMLLGSVVITGKYNGFKLNFDLLNVYELREEVTDMHLPVIVNYFKPVASSMIPIGIMFFLKHKKYYLVFLFSIVQMFLFAFGGHKTTLFFLLIAIYAYIFLKYNIKNKVIISLTILNIAGMLEGIVAQDLSYIVAFMQRRNMFTTNQLSTWYFRFFSLHEPDFLKQSIFRYLGFRSEYNIPIPKLIMYEFTGTYGSANNGMVGDAFGNFGWAGLFYPLLLVIAFRIFDYCTEGISADILVVVSAIFAINFINSSFFPVLLTHGFIFTTFALYCYPRREENIFEKEKKKVVDNLKRAMYSTNFKN